MSTQNTFFKFFTHTTQWSFRAILKCHNSVLPIICSIRHFVDGSHTFTLCFNTLVNHGLLEFFLKDSKQFSCVEFTCLLVFLISDQYIMLDSCACFCSLHLLLVIFYGLMQHHIDEKIQKVRFVHWQNHQKMHLYFYFFELKHTCKKAIIKVCTNPMVSILVHSCKPTCWRDLVFLF